MMRSGSHELAEDCAVCSCLSSASAAVPDLRIPVFHSSMVCSSCSDAPSLGNVGLLPVNKIRRIGGGLVNRRHTGRLTPSERFHSLPRASAQFVPPNRARCRRGFPQSRDPDCMSVLIMNNQIRKCREGGGRGDKLRPNDWLTAL